jgi:hypothetical protein
MAMSVTVTNGDLALFEQLIKDVRGEIRRINEKLTDLEATLARVQSKPKPRRENKVP